MASPRTRRPLPALLMLLALFALAGLIWWRVLNRSSGSTASPTAAGTPCPTHAYAVRLPAPAAVAVQVLNATRRNGIAGKARAALLAAGFPVPQPAADDAPKRLNTVTATAQIRYGPASAQGAQLLRYYFPGAELMRTTSTSRTVVVSLGKSYRGVPAPAAVRRALAKDNAVVGDPTPSPARTC